MNGQQITTLQPPVSIPMLTSGGILSTEWRQWFNAMSQFLIRYQNVIPVPTLTTAQIATLNPIENGFIVYNITTQSFQGYVDGAWKTFTLS